MRASALRGKESGSWWSIYPGGYNSSRPNQTGEPRRVSEHALLRYLQRYVFVERGDETSITDYTFDERTNALAVLIRHLRAGEFVERERGTEQTIWKMPNGVLFVVLDDLVKTVLSENRKGYRT